VTSGCDAAGGPSDPAFDRAVEALIHKSGAADTKARAIVWSLSPIRPRWATQRAYIEAVSQLLHAERLTRRACSHLATALADPVALRFVESQARDEARHAAMYTQYLTSIGDIAPMDQALAAALDGALQWHDSVPAMMVAFNVVLEGKAVHLHGAATRAFPCPLLHQIATTVGRDEARHTAFGQRYLTRELAPLGTDERRAIYLDVRALWRAVAARSCGAPGAVTWRRAGAPICGRSSVSA